MRTVQWLDLAAVTPDGRRFPAVLVAIAAAWLTIVIAQTSGNAAALHHHALIEGGTPPAVAITTFLATWQIMVVAMMWPASLPAIRSFRESGWIPRPRLAVATFLGTSATVWASFGLAAFLGDMALHHRRRCDALARGTAVAHRSRRPRGRWRLSVHAAQTALSGGLSPTNGSNDARQARRMGPNSSRPPSRFRLSRQLVGADACHVRRRFRQLVVDGGSLRPDGLRGNGATREARRDGGGHRAAPGRLDRPVGPIPRSCLALRIIARCKQGRNSRPVHPDFRWDTDLVSSVLDAPMGNHRPT